MAWIISSLVASPLPVANFFSLVGAIIIGSVPPLRMNDNSLKIPRTSLKVVSRLLLYRDALSMHVWVNIVQSACSRNFKVADQM